ncbi:MAG: DUF4332 domain-containing protein [Myxococcota bacterium]
MNVCTFSASVPRVAALTAIVGALCVLAPDEAAASHYRLPAAGLVTEAEHEALREADVDTTLALFEAAAKAEARRDLSRRTGLSYARMTELATQCDLLRVRGVGPTMVRLLQAAGVRHTTDLRKASPATLHERIIAANEAHGITEVLPGEDSLGDWIEQARGLPKVLEGVR